MTKKIIFSAGGTGGHIFPAINLMKYLSNKGYDVFNALDIQKNEEFLKDLKFGVGDGNLHYYFFNWRIQKLQAKDCGIVLV